jgi:hypothetical protein
MADPNRNICPDYKEPEYDDAHIIFTVEGKTDAEAAAILRNLWRFNNTKAIEAWDRQREAETEARCQQEEQEEQEEERLRARREAEEEEAKQEERKKYKSKFAPISDRPLPSTALLLPSQHTLNKLRKGDYVPLYNFTNKGIHEAEEEGSGDDDLLTLVQTDKGPMFQTAAAAKAKKHKVKDEHLSWEEFGQASYRMLNSLRQQEWPEVRIEMIRDFWITLESHDWRHEPSNSRKKALLIYQGRVHRDWHKTLGTPDAFRLLLLNAEHLHEYHQEVLDSAYAAKIDTIQPVRIREPVLRTCANHSYHSLSSYPPPFFLLLSTPLSTLMPETTNYSLRVLMFK